MRWCSSRWRGPTTELQDFKGKTVTHTELTASHAPDKTWVPACDLGDLLPDQGVCALIHGKQIALFLVQERVFALSNHDPFTGSNTLSRGLVGSYTLDGASRLKVAAPLLKQAFDLQSGQCITEPDISVPTYPVRLEGSKVWIGSGG